MRFWAPILAFLMRLIALPVLIMSYLDEDLSKAANGCRRPGNAAYSTRRGDSEDALICRPEDIDWVQIVVECCGLHRPASQSWRTKTPVVHSRRRAHMCLCGIW